MPTVTLRFYEELNDFLPSPLRKRDIEREIQPGESLKHLIESMGVPHTEIEVVLVNGISVDLGPQLQGGERISVYPQFESLDVTPLLRLRERPLRTTRFVTDAHLGRLARYLRLLGFDTLFFNDIGDQRLVEISVSERRILLTRDRALLMRRTITHGCYVHAIEPWLQLAEVVERLDLTGQIRPFSRCMVCNGAIVAIRKEHIEEPLPDQVIRQHDQFWRCRDCRKIYWQGSHYSNLLKSIAGLVADNGSSGDVVS
ncbi:MAG: Mut7-C ubiquitin/RNAse domain-containing protein [Candidatus Thiodiazotropha weberae]|uniref:Mut7-C RNAse domain-containing protein n=1 Tax=Candidatus Thiodiazotropha endoloripes TaxID=1818881 RepID=UPI00083DEDFE|nr:Mut7-C RNAse domain-containing protein [Candidatus Thiodiazotropha endoloripes]MCG7899807.1 Mut7-C ubiquitin/RNAse domain-containing protein [Candidatus Thiodiazotropha weberae]MCG7903235.1 Mut7-C ubiquitin/RNAse domain-containing protein [Candidatus Thiodiazotropha weberae]MCG7912495.1 Mut7-C ubiquitin/RNAse domain-containing protein [Candidatus Thiodiazotropha weberae]ODB94208.1 twitching motility protein PilT [Candidatus Thiodiazotropha endoloripes]